MTVADDCLCEIAPADLDAWDDEKAVRVLGSSTGPGRADLRLRMAARPVVPFMISLKHGQPGGEIADDATWAASVALERRSVRRRGCAGLDERAVARNLRLLGQIDALIGRWPEPEWTDAVRQRLEQLVEARRAGRRRGEELRRGRPARTWQLEPKVALLLRHPGDHWFRRARAAVEDLTLSAVIEEWIADFAASYDAMAAGDWSRDERLADLVVELEFGDELPPGSEKPLPARVVASLRGGLTSGSQVRMRLDADPDAQCNGTRVSVLGGERWRTCATLLPDESILPEDGTRRLAA